MNQKSDNNDLFHASQLTILLTFTIFSVILIAESILMQCIHDHLILGCCFSLVIWHRGDDF